MKIKTEWINFRVDADVKKRLARIADKQHRSLSSLMSILANDFDARNLVNTPLPTEESRGQGL